MRSPHTATNSSPRSLQLEKVRAQQQRPNAAKNKENKSLKKKKSHYVIGILLWQLKYSPPEETDAITKLLVQKVAVM